LAAQASSEESLLCLEKVNEDISLSKTLQEHMQGEVVAIKNTLSRVEKDASLKLVELDSLLNNLHGVDELQDSHAQALESRREQQARLRRQVRSLHTPPHLSLMFLCALDTARCFPVTSPHSSV
jgi:dsDNA-specific endonuclease/ATPase MutS2